MPILAIDKEIEIELTHECNWNCPYCAIHVHQQGPINHQQASDKIRSIKPNSVVTLSGGEPGLIKREHIEYYIHELKQKNCILYLNTNGTFLEKYPDLISNFEQIIYHCSENLDKKEFKIYDSYDNIDYMIIVNDSNIDQLEEFLKINDKVKFSIVEATYNEDGAGPTLSKANKHLIMTKFSKYMTKDSIRRMIHEKEFDRMFFI